MITDIVGREPHSDFPGPYLRMTRGMRLRRVTELSGRTVGVTRRHGLPTSRPGVGLQVGLM
jgi:hypothetical protein